LEKKWDWEITADTSNWSWDIRSLLSYRHLLGSLVRKNFIINYKQTVLGPAWILLQPILTLFVYVLVFGKLIRVPTGDVPPPLFYLSGIVIWNFFNESFSATSRTFRDYIHIFTKVYFPRIIIPLSTISTQLMRFMVQFLFLVAMLAEVYGGAPDGCHRRVRATGASDVKGGRTIASHGDTPAHRRADVRP